MENIWQVLPKIEEKLLKKYSGYNKIILQLFINRGLLEKYEIEEFLDPDYKRYFLDPFLFKNMKAACELIIKHIKAGSKITVYGDFDADGVTASVVLIEILKILKAKVSVYIPSRATEGYGLNKKALDELCKEKINLVVTVDNGIRNKEEVEYAKSLGIDVIISDHHEPPENKNDWPDCLIINPMAETYPGHNLAGVGVAFKLGKALISLSKISDDIKNKIEYSVLDLVAVGTVADMVSLLEENRILVHEGLKVINENKRLGLNELIVVSQINNNSNRKINALNIGWQIAPRLNSAGRLAHANVAYELLITKDRKEAKEIAEKLNDKNKERQKITDDIVENCRKYIDENLLADKILVIYSVDVIKNGDDGGWPEGVVGLVAGRLCDKYSRPVLVITESHDEIKGSGRSISEFDIVKAIEMTKEFFSKFGGHVQACGFTFKKGADLKKFFEKIKDIANKKLKDIDLQPKINIDCEIELSDIDDRLVDALENFEPFGEDNSRPKFLTKDIKVVDKMMMGADGQHIKFRFNGLPAQTSFWALGFGQTENWKHLDIGDRVDLVYCLEFNDFNGRRAIQMKIVDIKRHELINE